MSIQVGNTLGEFTITKGLSDAGGFADIFEATAPNGTPVAVKVLRDGADDLCQYLFRNEAQILQQLAQRDHPHIVKCIAADTAADHPFIVMERLQSDLYSKIPAPGNVIPSGNATRFIHQACSALIPIHECGWVHHDVHPHNMLFASGDAIKLIDFGIAYAPDEPKPDRKLGIDLFLSPEVRGGTRDDPRSDLYSLGMTYFWLLTSRRFVRHLTDPLPDVEEYAGVKISDTQQHVLTRLCEKTADDRFATASEALDAIADAMT